MSLETDQQEVEDVDAPDAREPDAFSVEWQLGPDEEAASSVIQTAQNDEARMLERRLLRLYSIYNPTP
jgi:hypothetical protein